MSPISLKRVLAKKELLNTLTTLLKELDLSLGIEDLDGKWLFGAKSSDPSKHPISLSGEVIGWVVGNEKTTAIAELISYIVKQEVEKRGLATELLEKYQEIDLFQDLSTQITTSLDLQEVAQMVLQEVRKLIESTQGAILLLDPSTGELKVLSEYGDTYFQNPLQLGEGMIGSIVQSGRPEIINEIGADSLANQEEPLKSLICVPLQGKDWMIGAIAVGHESTTIYTAEHLKLLSIFATQTSVAIEKALLYQQSCAVAAQAQAQAEQLQQTLRELQSTQARLVQSEKMSGLGQLVAGVAHEINNPVNFIYGNLTFATDYVQDLLQLLHNYQQVLPATPELQEQIEAIDLEFLRADLPNLLVSMKVGADRIAEIVRSLKNFSRHDEAEMKSVNIHEGIDSTLMILRSRLKAQDDRPAIQVIKEYGELPLIECYPGQLNQVFMNILVNAIDALEERGKSSTSRTASVPPDRPPAPTIRIHTEILENHSVIIRIIDNGPGIPDDVMQRLYDPFFTTKEVGKGTGLGMAISHQIVLEQHGGVLKCHSEIGEGTEFWIQIPISRAVSNPTPAVDAATIVTYCAETLG